MKETFFAVYARTITRAEDRRTIAGRVGRIERADTQTKPTKADFARARQILKLKPNQEITELRPE